MAERLPTQAEFVQQAEKGILFTQQQVAAISQKEYKHNSPAGLAAGGPAATGQSFYNKQQNFLTEADRLVEKPVDTITKEEASHLMSLESKALAGTRPSKGSLSSALQSLTDHNLIATETDNKPHQDVGTLITKDDAAKAMHDEAISHNGAVSRGSIATQIQSIADKTAHLKDSLADNLDKATP
ncbi:hypothetical protein ABW20_dc0105070 [Dactylellina cionopaga]|nr:hypothetical protein ABW20_dc0105070 [Dactylellina cionopaga]